MSVSYVNRKCDCGGKLEYDKNRKIWKCLYCGSEVEREEQYNGMFTIKNVVRQTIKDVADRNLESAEKNLLECEKIDSRYVGTLIANLCLLMIQATSGSLAGESEMRNTIAKIKRANETLQSLYNTLTDEEEVLYEFFDSSDIYATLLLTYDSLNDTKRKMHIAQLLKIEEVYSKETNNSLLSYALKNQDLAMLDGIIKNCDNVDKKFALLEVLTRYPDGEQKVQNINILFAKQAFTKAERELVERYLADSIDSIATKAKVVVAASSSGVKPNINSILRNVLSNTTDTVLINTILTEVCNTKLNDEEIFRMIDFSFEATHPDVSLICLDCLKASKQFVSLGQKHITALLSRTDLLVNDKLQILKKAYAFNIDPKSYEGVVNHYLCFNQDAPESRNIIFPFLLTTVKTIPTSTLESYILKCTTDGDCKPDIVKDLLALESNTSFYHDLLSKYIFTQIDTYETKGKIIEALLDKGLKVEPKAFAQYICSETDLGQSKIIFIKKMIANGSILKSDTVSIYLTGMTSFEFFDSELFALLLTDNAIVTDAALINYLLYCKDKDAHKSQNAFLMGSLCGKPFGSQLCRIKHNGNDIDCNLLQGYILTTTDLYAVASSIVKHMINAKTKINAELRLSSGKSEKLKKYVSANKSHLSPLTKQLCEEYKVFSMLF